MRILQLLTGQSTLSTQELKSTLGEIKSLALDKVDPVGAAVGTAAATVARVAVVPIEGISYTWQLCAFEGGSAKPVTFSEACKQNFNWRDIPGSYRGATAAAKAALLSSVAYYGVAAGIMSQQSDKPIYVQGAWCLITVPLEQWSVGSATEYVRTRHNLNAIPISPMGRRRINAAFAFRHMGGNPGTTCAALYLEKSFNEVVPKEYKLLASFAAGVVAVFGIHQAFYARWVAFSVKTMGVPEQSLRESWRQASQAPYLKAGYARALSRSLVMGTVMVALRAYERATNDVELRDELGASNVNRASFFSSPEVSEATDSQKTFFTICMNQD